jgi:4-hydroxy-tetrahydrodipicolinate synthase
MPALITPFGQRGEVDLKAHTRNLRVLAEAGIEGYLIGGSNGEGPYLEAGERGRLIKAGRRRRAHFMAGIAAESTRVALAQLDEVTEAGADSVLVLTPTTIARNRDEAVLRFYRTIAVSSRSWTPPPATSSSTRGPRGP